MTEKSPPASQNLPPLTDTDRAFLNADNADSWRAMQHAVLNEMRTTADSSYVTRFSDSIDDTIDIYLNTHGIDETNPRRDNFREVFRLISIDKVSDDKWLYAPSSRGEQVSDPADDISDREAFMQFSAAPETPAGRTAAADTRVDPPQHDTVQAAREAVRVALETSREDFAVKSAKRQGRAIGKGGVEYEESQQRYFANVQENGRMQFADEIARQDEMSDSEKQALNVKVLEYIFKEQKKLSTQTTEKLNNTRVGKFVEKFGGWMQEGGVKERLVKGFMVSAAIGAAAGIAGALTFGAGGAVVGGAAAATLRTARIYAGADHGTRGVPEFTDEHKTRMHEAAIADGNSDVEAYFAATTSYARAQHELDTKEQQKNRKKSIGKSALFGALPALGGAAAGAWALHEITEQLSDHDLVSWDQYEFTTPKIDDLPGPVGSSAPDLPSGDLPDILPADGDSGSSVVHELAQPTEAFTVKCGEGWNQTFKEMGIPKSQWNSVLHDAGPELNKQGWAYFDDGHGEWRITKPGTLSQQAMETIAKASTKRGYDLAV